MLTELLYAAGDPIGDESLGGWVIIGIVVGIILLWGGSGDKRR